MATSTGGLDLAGLIQAAQLGRSLNPEFMQQQALGNQLALQLQQLQAQKIQQDLADPQRALRDAAILEDIRSGGTLGLSVLDEGQQALGPLLQPTGINRLAYSPASADAANKRLLDQFFAKEQGLQQVRSQFDRPLTMMMDGREVYAQRGPGGTIVPLERVIPEVRTTQPIGALNIPQAPSQPRVDESSLQSLIEVTMGGLGTDQGLAGMAIPEGSRETIVPERRELVEAAPRFGSTRGLTANVRLDHARRQGIAGIPESEVTLNTPEEKAAYQAALKSRGSPEKLRKEFNSLQQVKSFRELDRQLGLMRSAFAQLKTNTNRGPIDQVLITTFNKILDPDSVVRESEYARTPEGAALLRRIEGKIESFTRGGVAFTDADRQDLLNVAEQLYSAGQQTYNETRDFYQGIAGETNINPSMVFQGGGSIASPVATPGINPNAPAPIKINSIRPKRQ